MNWFDTSGFTTLAKTALKEAQKTIDKALDIQDESGEEHEDASPTQSQPDSTPGTSKTSPKDSSDFFSSWGLTVSAESAGDEPIQEQPVVTESPSKSVTQSMWGSFAGSFFEQSNTSQETVTVPPPKAKSMNVISSKSDSHEDLFSKSQLVLSDTADIKITKAESSTKGEDRRSSSRCNRLSLVSSRNSSDSVEVLSQSLKSTPDSEAASVSRSSSLGLKLNSESVEILPDSLVSPSSIECLGFDSYTSGKNSSTSSLSPGDPSSDKKSAPCDRTERAETGDSVSLVADDDEDTMSYNSISECTAPTVLDTDDKPISPFQKAKFDAKKAMDIHLEQPLLSQRMQISENSSNDGSWSDRTLNADNDSINLDITLEEKEETETEDVLTEKLSDSSSFYNINMSENMIKSESSYINVEKQCVTDSSDSSQKECSLKERNSPISSDSKSDLVKIGSDRTSGHTSGDEVETATSSDIEIIPSPNGDGHFRGSPGKYVRPKLDGAVSPNLVDLVLGKSLATKIRGHNRELSETSIQSNVSDESQGSESERMMRRLCEMAEILEARENRLMEVSRSNAELAENNADLKTQVETLLARHEAGDISIITEDYTQRMSALEKKFQQAIREKDQLRKQLDALKTDSSRKNSSEFENALKEKDEVIAQLQEEGEKLAKQQLHNSNIIKKLRAKEKDNEQVIKNLRDKIADQSSELDRLKRALAAKDEVEVSQIEAVYRLTTANKKMETELLETKSSYDDTLQRLESTRTSLEAVRSELSELQRSSAELEKSRFLYQTSCEEKQAAEERAGRLQAQLDQIRVEFVNEQKRWSTREASLQEQLSSALMRDEGLSSGGNVVEGGALLGQLASLQRANVDKEMRCNALALTVAQTETSLAKAVERERLARDEAQNLRDTLSTCEGLLRDAQNQLHLAEERYQSSQEKVAALEELLQSKSRELDHLREDMESQVDALRTRASETEDARASETALLDAERKRNAILQEQLSSRLDLSPPHSIASESLSASFWNSDDPPSLVTPAAHVEQALAEAGRAGGALAGLRAELLAARHERDALRARVAQLQAESDHCRSVQEQYDALLEMYGEKEEQLSELKLDLHDVTLLYKAQLDELVQLRAGTSG